MPNNEWDFERYDQEKEFENMIKSQELDQDFRRVLSSNGRKERVIGILHETDAIEILIEQLSGRKPLKKDDVATCLNFLAHSHDEYTFYDDAVEESDIKIVSTKDAISREEFLLRNKNIQAKEVANMFWPIE